MRDKKAVLIIADSEKDSNMYYATGFLAPDPFIYIQKDKEKIMVTNVSREGETRDNDKRAQIDKFKDGLKKVSRTYSKINWIGIVLHIAYQEVEFFNVNNNWHLFAIPSKEFNEALNNNFSIY